MNDADQQNTTANEHYSLVVMVTDVADESYAQKLSELWQLPLIKRYEANNCKENPPADFSLKVTEQPHQIVLQPHCFDSGPITIDFRTGKARHRLNFGGGKKQPLARAIGLGHKNQPSQPLTVCDATAGFGKDAWVLASLGCKVTALERCPWLFGMLKQAVCDARNDREIADITQRVESLNVDSADWLRTTKTKLDVVYMDPMYPASDKSASVKKDMQALQRLLGTDTDSSALLDAAMGTARWRVVVKRPKRAPPIASAVAGLEHSPVSNITSVNTRYDIYSVKRS